MNVLQNSQNLNSKYIEKHILEPETGNIVKIKVILFDISFLGGGGSEKYLFI